MLSHVARKVGNIHPPFGVHSCLLEKLKGTNVT